MHRVSLRKSQGYLWNLMMQNAFNAVGKPFNNPYLLVAEQALEYAEYILKDLLPDGELRGTEYVALNPHRDDRELGSFKINAETGLWCDFADDTDEAKGGDLISLVAYVLDVSQSKAKRWIETFIAELEGEETPTAALNSPALVKQGMVAVKRASDINQAPEAKRAMDETTLVSPVPADALPVPKVFGLRGAPTHTWAYKDAQGAVLCLILRFDRPDGKKDICPLTYHVDGNGRAFWKMQGLPSNRPLYHLDQLTARPAAPVILVEGEKSADAAAILFPDRVAVTTIGGSNGTGKADFTPLAGRDVLIWPDADEPGQKYAQEVAKSLLALSEPATVQILPPIGCSAGHDEKTKQPILCDGFTSPKGWDAADALAEGWTAEHAKLLTLPEPVASSVSPDAQPSGSLVQDFETPIGDFRLDAQGVYFLRRTQKSEAWDWLCAPLSILAETRSTANKNWGRLVEFQDADGVVHRVVLSLTSLQSDNFLKQLVDKGLRVSPTPAHREKLIGYLTTVKITERATCMDRVGWNNGVFLLPDQSFGASNEQVVLQDDGKIDRSVFATSGSHGDWQEHVGKACIGNSRLVLAIAAALAGPFLELTGMESGGFHFRGNSSIGKTITLLAAASVWSSNKYIRQWRATANGLEATALTHNSTILLLDELAQVSPVEVGEVIYMLGNGQGKTRSTRSGGIASSATWRLLYLSTGEVSLANHMGGVGKKAMAGQETRLLDLPADAGKGYGVFDTIGGYESSQQLADHLKSQAMTYYGTAGIELLKHLATEGERVALTDQVKQYQVEFVERYRGTITEGQVLRALTRFGFVAAVGRVCSELGILSWPVDEAFQSCAICFHTWLEARGGDVSVEQRQIIDQAIGILQRFGESRFTELGIKGIDDERLLSKSNDRIGFKRVLNENYVFYVETEPFKSLFCAGFHRDDVIRILAEEGILQLGRDGGPTENMRCGEFGQNRVYVLKMPVMIDPST